MSKKKRRKCEESPSVKQYIYINKYKCVRNKYGMMKAIVGTALFYFLSTIVSFDHSLDKRICVYVCVIYVRANDCL